MIQAPTPNLWFDGNAEEAMNFYLSIFPNSKVLSIARYGDAGPGPKGSVLTVTFELNGQQFVGINGGPHYKFTPAVSFSVFCDAQGEIDTLWEKLLDGGLANRCGWLDDKFGLSWQIVPKVLPEYLGDADPAKANRVMTAMLKMVKLDIATLTAAYEGR
jgi:predicted 3-demethylubiquinone-9 3-methyltransferase (glyoxalase superfamily)